MVRFMKKIVCVLSVLSCFCVYGNDITDNSTSVSAERNTQEETFQRIYSKFNIAAKQLAGSYIPDEFANDSEYIDCINSVNQKWSQLEEKSLSHVKPWAEKNISNMITDADTVFYPFGGPDIAYATQFFPHADTYVLLGLEPIGNFAHVESRLHNKATFEGLQRALSAYLDKGYFITSEMMTQLSRKDIRGCVYLLLLELSKLGYTITSVEDVSVDSDGKEVKRNDGVLDAIKIKCAKDGQSKTVYYMRIDLTRAEKLPNIMHFMENRKFVTFIKSASYALHDRNFTTIRKFILDYAQAVLQDDTGIPFYFFDSKWDKYPFGQYTQPTLPIFEQYRQQTLSDFFAKREPVSIPFKIGYGFNQNRPNLLLAIPTAREQFKQIQAIYSKTEGGCNCNKKKKVVVRVNQETVPQERNSRIKMTINRSVGKPAVAIAKLVK